MSYIQSGGNEGICNNMNSNNVHMVIDETAKSPVTVIKLLKTYLCVKVHNNKRLIHFFEK